MNHVTPTRASAAPSPRSFLVTASLSAVGVSLLAACGGGGGGSAPPPAQSTLAGTLDVPVVAPARIVSVTEAQRPMRAGEVVVWLEPGASPPDLTPFGLVPIQLGGPIAVYENAAARNMATLETGVAVQDSAEYATVASAGEIGDVPGVRLAQPNFMYQHGATPNDQFYDKQWHLPQINLPQAWDLTTGSTNVIVAVIDTGIKAAHPDFTGRLIAGYDMISDPSNAGDGDGIDADPEDTGDGVGTGQPSSFHGTHVAGTIGANGNNAVGVAGVGWNCKLMTLRALGRRGGSSADIANSILFASGLSNASGTVPPQRADVINMSLGGKGTDTVMEAACDQAFTAGVLLVAAAGNDNTSDRNTPAAAASVISVGAVDLVRARAPYSNFNSTIEIWAPGGDMTADLNGDQFPDGVLSCMADDAGQFFYSYENGTSMASPHVAGVAALIKAANPAFTAQQIRDALVNTSTAGQNLPNSGTVVDALAAVLSATGGGGGGGGGGAILVSTPSAVDYGTTLNVATVGFENRGSGTLTLVGAVETPVANWITAYNVTAAGTNINAGTISVPIDRGALGAGVYSTRTRFEFSDGTASSFVEVEFRMQVGDSTVSPDEMFVLLVDAVTFETKFQVQTNSSSTFQYAFSEVATGNYILVAGTDRDNDDFLGDEGELFGAWPNLDQRQEIELASTSTLNGLDFGMQETLVIQSAGAAGLPMLRRLR